MGDRRLGRRALLAAGGLAAVAGCSDSSSPPSGRPPTAPSSSSAAPSASAGLDWDQLRRSVQGSLVLPGDASYDTLRLLQDPRYDDERPRAVLSVSGPEDVATAFAFAQDHGLPVALRSGGHSYPGWSGGGKPEALVVDCRPLSGVTVDGTTATIGAGALLGDVYAALAAKGRAVAAGSCPTVAISGLTMGGGVGVLTRAMGLTCDAVTSMQVVTADGTVRTASADSEPDLFWALRGGGGGHVGTVTALTLTTTAAPTLQTVYLEWPFAAAAQVVEAWQAWAPVADARLWSTLKLLAGAQHPDGPTILLSGTWTGPAGALDAQLAGLLDHVPAPSTDARHNRTYGAAMAAYAGSGARQSEAATSHVAYDPLDATGIADLIAQLDGATAFDEAGVSIDALGGTDGDLAPDATAFVHRTALATVQYTATFPPGSAADADAYVRGFRAAMVPHWGTHAYVNYADATISDYQDAYFGANAARLAQVRAAYDPDGFFTQPQDW